MMKMLVLAAALVASAHAQHGPCSTVGVKTQMSAVMTPCGAKGSFMSVCDQRCADVFVPFWNNISKCTGLGSVASSLLNNTALRALAASCKMASTSTSSTSCSSASLFPVVMQCAQYTYGRVTAAKSAAFCDSQCYKLSQQFSGCKDRASRTFMSTLNALSGLDAGCAQSGQGPSSTKGAGLESKLNSACSSVQTKTPNACSSQCIRIMRYLLSSATYNVSTQATSSYKRLQPLVAYCQANHTTNDCKSSKGVELDEVMQVCCGAKAKRCAAGKLPKNCSSVCSGAFLPYYSDCGHTAFQGRQLKAMVGFARTCGAQNGRWTATKPDSTAGVSGPNPKDPCSQHSGCGQCTGKCGYCRDEVTNRTLLKVTHGGWCSSDCETTPGECSWHKGTKKGSAKTAN